MDLLAPLGAVQRLNPIAFAADKALDATLRPRFFPRVRFDEPPGDPGWFGPGSAVWHVHEHFPALALGLGAAATIETLHPDFAWMGYDHTRAIVRDADGVPAGGFDREGLLTRGGHSFSFFAAVAYGASPMAERVTRAVAGMHHRVRGVRPDGRAYDADDPETLRWAYATVVWGIATAHERYHLRPLPDIDDYYREFVRVGEALGGTDLPATKAQVLACLDAAVPLMGVTAPDRRDAEADRARAPAGGSAPDVRPRVMDAAGPAARLGAGAAAGAAQSPRSSALPAARR